MKLSLFIIFSLFLITSCGSNNDDDNRFLNTAYGNCGANTVGAFNNFNNFNSGFQNGYMNPYQLEMARRCGYSLMNTNCALPQNGQFINRYDSINPEMIQNSVVEIEAELRDVHGIVDPLSDAELKHYYTQVGFYAGVNTGAGYGYGPYGSPYGYGGGIGGGIGANPYGFCDQLSLQ